jgi:hypothetical protein
VSVIHEVVRKPEYSVSTRKAGTRRRPPLTSSREPTSTTIGYELSVAGSKIVHV